MDFSAIDISMRKYVDELNSIKRIDTAPPFTPDELSEKATKKRVESALANFWKFDEIYFSKDQYNSGYSKPNQMLKDVVRITGNIGVYVVLGPRKHGKTVTLKKLAVWRLLRGDDTISASYSQNLPIAKSIIRDIIDILATNPKLMHDFKPEFAAKSDEALQVRFGKNTTPNYRYWAPFSEDRSLRGYGRVFDRPTFCIVDDCETLTSSLKPEAVQERIEKLSEAYNSLDDTKGLMIVLSNNFDKRCAMNQIKEGVENGVYPEHWHVLVYKAWTDKQKPLWPERYKVNSEAELKKRLKPKDEADWLGNYQQSPIPPEGVVFKREHYKEWITIPPDLRAVCYCDPNLSKKGQGDSTGITTLGFSVETQMFYVVSARCKSFSDPLQLLDALSEQYAPSYVYSVGMDGHVTQESVWDANIRSWSKIKKRPFRRVEFLRLRVDDLVKNLQFAYVEGRVFFPPNFALSQEGAEYLSQLFAFHGKKANRRDDAPDSLVCAFEMLHQENFVREKKSNLLGLNTNINFDSFMF